MVAVGFAGATPFGGHAGTVLCVAFSPVGSTVATGGKDGTVRLWDPASGTQQRQLDGHTGSVYAVAWSPDGTILATAGHDGTARLWDAATGTQHRQLDGHIGRVWSVAWSPDGTTLATAGDDATARLWDAATGTQHRQLDGHTGYVLSVAWSPDGTSLATASIDTTARLWDAATGTQDRQLDGHTGFVSSVAWSPDGATLATAGDDGTARLWDAVTGAQHRKVDCHTGMVWSVAWSPDGTTLATVGDGTARLWDPATGTQHRQLDGHTGYVLSVAWSPDGATLATAGDDGTARLWDAVTGAQHRQLDGHIGSVRRIAWNPDGTTLATAGNDGTLRLWDPATGTQHRQLDGHTGWVWSVAWSPDGTTLATAGGDGTARLWDPATGTQHRQLDGHTGSVSSVAWNPDGTTLATAGDDGTARLWDPATGIQHRQLDGHTGSVMSVAWNPDGTTLASVSHDGTIRIWNPRNGIQINGTGFGEARAPARALAGVSSDEPSAIDLLGVGEDVATLAELIAANETVPPLAVALIGDWGTGKSSVLCQVAAHLDRLAAQARNNPGLSAFAENVRQVRFNAWHYSDDQLWAGLVTHLFEVLAAPRDEAAADGVFGQSGTRKELAGARTEVAAREAELSAAKLEETRLAGQLRAIDDAGRPQGVLGWLGAPAQVLKVLLVACRQAVRDVRAGLTALVGWAVLAGAAYAAWHFFGTWAGSVASAVVVLAAPAVAAAGRLRLAHRAVLRFADEQQTRLDEQHKQAQQRVQEAEQQVREAKDQQLLVDAAERLGRFVDERGADGAYREHRGLLGQVRADLDRLSADLKAARGQWELSGRFGPPPLERIVLYIDDLDRCPPRRVVEVLEAVHLMLALDLFVVVVAVDARWLVRSLEIHHHELFGRDGDGAGGGGGEAVATPIDYLDKIFQIPFALVPPGPEATGAYLRSMLPVVEPAVGPATSPVAGHESPEEPNHGDAAAGEGGNEDAADPDLDTVDAWQSAYAQLRAELEPALGLQLAEGRGRRFGDGEAGGGRVIELRPRGLRVTPPEVEFMTQLGGLLPTPRAAKRLVNLYRLVRIGVPEGDLSQFVGDASGGSYQAVQVLLGLLVGQPLLAREVFRVVLAGETVGDLADLVAETGGVGGKPHSFGLISAFLLKLREEAPLAVSMTECRRWCSRLARFSFYTRDLVGG
jgi:WD40 repeat protein